MGLLIQKKRGVLKGKTKGGMYGGADEEPIKKGEDETKETEIDENEDPENPTEIDENDETDEIDENDKTEDNDENDEADNGVDNYSSQDLLDAQQKIASAQYERISTLQTQVENMEDEMKELKENNGILEQQLVDGVGGIPLYLTA